MAPTRIVYQRKAKKKKGEHPPLLRRSSRKITKPTRFSDQGEKFSHFVHPSSSLQTSHQEAPHNPLLAFANIIFEHLETPILTTNPHPTPPSHPTAGKHQPPATITAGEQPPQVAAPSAAVRVEPPISGDAQTVGRITRHPPVRLDLNLTPLELDEKPTAIFEIGSSSGTKTHPLHLMDLLPTTMSEEEKKVFFNEPPSSGSAKPFCFEKNKKRKRAISITEFKAWEAYQNEQKRQAIQKAEQSLLAKLWPNLLAMQTRIMNDYATITELNDLLIRKDEVIMGQQEAIQISMEMAEIGIARVNELEQNWLVHEGWALPENEVQEEELPVDVLHLGDGDVDNPPPTPSE